MDLIRVSKKLKNLEGEVRLPPSKSLSNRALIIAHLGGFIDLIKNLSDADDTRLLLKNLNIPSGNSINSGDGGTTFRFILATNALKGWTGEMSGSLAFNKRPIATLVDVLRVLGASIDYLDQEGYPSLYLNGFHPKDVKKLSIKADVSSQFISAIIMNAPYLKNGLQIELTGQIVSRPYITMTVELMKYFRAKIKFQGNSIHIEEGIYTPKSYQVESDWSAAAFFFEGLALARSGELVFKGLNEKSLQGDSALIKYAPTYGLKFDWEKGYCRLIKKGIPSSSSIVLDLIGEPDLAPALIVASAGLHRKDSFSGLQTLNIKESNRLQALQQELQKINCNVSYGTDLLEIIGFTIEKEKSDTPEFEVYNDHRIAMALAQLALLAPVQIKDPDTVNKSFPEYWKVLSELGYQIEGV
jgi:3-phosphoshikimate 1-carboxyvinyltransferase